MKVILAATIAAVVARCEGGELRAVPRVAARMADPGSPNSDGVEAILATAMDRSAKVGERAMALRILGARGVQGVSARIASVLADVREERAVRIAAAAAISDLDGTGAEAALTEIARSRSDDPLIRFWAAIDAAVVTGGAIGDVEVARAMAVSPQALPPAGPEGIGDEDALYTRLAAFHAVAEHGTTSAVRSIARRLVRSIFAYDALGYHWDLDRNLPVYLLMASYFATALVALAATRRRWLPRRGAPLWTLVILVAALAPGFAIPRAFDAIVPLAFDDPGWRVNRERMLLGLCENENLPRAGLSRLCVGPASLDNHTEGEEHPLK